jgi:hydroxymethylpyrimidine pyrophosphatase-like HAD family hydrolase
VRFSVLACDFDGTIATGGVIAPMVRDALRRVSASGRRLILVTGRTLAQLQPVPEGVELFDLWVLEDGALLVDPRGGAERLLAEPVPSALVAELERRGMSPLVVGRVLCATDSRHAAEVQEVVDEMRLPVRLVLNKDGVMVLPAGVDKATGAREALRTLGATLESCVAVGDAENDIPLIEAAGCGVAVGGSVDALSAAADLALAPVNGAGVVELAVALVGDDLASMLAGVSAWSRPGSAPQRR